jgi:hypothetical protein
VSTRTELAALYGVGVDPLGDPGIRDAAGVVLEERLGDDPAARALWWAAYPTWPGSLTQLLAVVQACTVNRHGPQSTGRYDRSLSANSVGDSWRWVCATGEETGTMATMRNNDKSDRPQAEEGSSTDAVLSRIWAKVVNSGTQDGVAALREWRAEADTRRWAQLEAGEMPSEDVS